MSSSRPCSTPSCAAASPNDRPTGSRAPASWRGRPPRRSTIPIAGQRRRPEPPTSGRRRCRGPRRRSSGGKRSSRSSAPCSSRERAGALTLTGPGGSGKTRLGLELAARNVSRFADGVHLVALASIQDVSLLASAVAQTLGLLESGERSYEELVEQRLREGECLVLLDNVEHLVPAASPLLARLASTADRSRLTLTSRAALGVSGEQEYPLHPLPPDDAAMLFETRARAVKPSLVIDEEGAAAHVASICRRLDGLPLAIELAAARVRLFSPKALLTRLDERLSLLTGGPADAPARQQTLRATIDWSYELLEPEQRRLFAALSVFPGGARLDAVEAVYAGDLESLDQLVRQCLAVVSDDPDGEPRFSMLETIREYAAERLEAPGDAEQVLRARTDYMLQLVEQANLRGPDQLEMVRAAARRAGQHPGLTRLGTRVRGADHDWRARGHIRPLVGPRPFPRGS